MSAIRYKKSAQLKYNLLYYLDNQFINAGLYNTVASGQLSVRGSRIDVLKRVSPTLYESQFDRWIYQTDASGIAGYAPIVCSGCYINDVWYAKGASPYIPRINYAEGKIVFSTAIPSSATVSTIFSQRHVNVVFPDNNIVNLLFSTPKDNTQYIAHQYPSGIQQQLPVVIIDLQRIDATPWQIGGGKTWQQMVTFHVLANNDTDVDNVVDILTMQYRKVINGVDFNKTPEMLTYQGDVANSYVPYSDMQNDSSYLWTKIYVDSVRVVERDIFFDYRRARVDWNVTFYRIVDD